MICIVWSGANFRMDIPSLFLLKTTVLVGKTKFKLRIEKVSHTVSISECMMKVTKQ